MQGNPPSADGISYELGHDIFVSLVMDLNGVVRNLKLDDLKGLSMTVAEAHRQALKNLESAWTAGRLKAHGFATPSGQKFLLVPDDWLASSCILLPSLADWANKYLGQSGPVLASVPHRDTMLVFSVGTRRSRDKMRALIRDQESNGPKPRTMELFLVQDGKVTAFREK